MQQIKAIAFDLDGTLVDSLPGLAAAINAMLVGLGKPQASIEQVSTWIGNGVPKLIQRALAVTEPTITQDDTLYHHAVTLFDQAYLERLGSHSSLYGGVLSTLDTLKTNGYRLSVITNKSQRFTLPMLEQLGVMNRFDFVLSGDSLERKKPDPAPLHHACQQYQITNHQLLMVGDSENDIIAAHRAGCLSVAVSYGYNYGKPIEASEPDYLIHSMRELLTLLELPLPQK